MTDMRATERLLEVISDAYASLRQMQSEKPFAPEVLVEHRAIAEAVGELRRRGDTLVRAADLRAVLERPARSAEGDLIVYPSVQKALERLEAALGGKMR